MTQRAIYLGLAALLLGCMGAVPKLMAASVAATMKPTTVTGFDCVVDLPDKLVPAKTVTGLTSDSVDNTYKMAGKSQMSCDSKGVMQLQCKVRLSKKELIALGGKLGSTYTYTNLTKCSFDRSICPGSASAGLVKSQKSTLTIQPLDDDLAPLKGEDFTNKTVAKVVCQYP